MFRKPRQKVGLTVDLEDNSWHEIGFAEIKTGFPTVD